MHQNDALGGIALLIFCMLMTMIVLIMITLPLMHDDDYVDIGYVDNGDD